jgi:hypothetical protein
MDYMDQVIEAVKVCKDIGKVAAIDQVYFLFQIREITLSRQLLYIFYFPKRIQYMSTLTTHFVCAHIFFHTIKVMMLGKIHPIIYDHMYFLHTSVVVIGILI